MVHQQNYKKKEMELKQRRCTYFSAVVCVNFSSNKIMMWNSSVSSIWLRWGRTRREVEKQDRKTQAMLIPFKQIRFHFHNLYKHTAHPNHSQIILGNWIYFAIKKHRLFPIQSFFISFLSTGTATVFEFRHLRPHQHIFLHRHTHCTTNCIACQCLYRCCLRLRA